MKAECVYLDKPALVFSEWQDHNWHSHGTGWDSAMNRSYRLETYGGEGEFLWRVSVGGEVLKKGVSNTPSNAKNAAMSAACEIVLEGSHG